MTVFHARLGFEYTITMPDDIGVDDALNMLHHQSDFRESPKPITQTYGGAPLVRWTAERVQIREIAPRNAELEGNRIEPAASEMLQYVVDSPMDRDRWWAGMNLLQQDIWPNPIDHDRCRVAEMVGMVSPRYAMELRAILSDLVDGIELRDAMKDGEFEASGAKAFAEALIAARHYLEST